MELAMKARYAELQVTTNYSFLRGASHPHEYVWRARELGYTAIGITDYNSFAGIIKAHQAARDADIQLCIGCRLTIDYQGDTTSQSLARSDEQCLQSVLVYPTSRSAYGKLCSLLSDGRQRTSKNDFLVSLDEFLSIQNECVSVIIPPFFQTRAHLQNNSVSLNTSTAIFYSLCSIIKENASAQKTSISIAFSLQYATTAKHAVTAVVQTSHALSIPLVATNDVFYHIAERYTLQDTLTAIRTGTTVAQAGTALFQNRERYLKAPAEMHRLFRDFPEALSRIHHITEIASGFSIAQLTYTYPKEIAPEGKTPHQYLKELTYKGAQERYPNGIPTTVHAALRSELLLIKELNYEKYFLTCFDIVSFAKKRGILCQGRGAAANSVVCFCLGITAVDPTKIDLLFARFVSKEREEPPDIDIDFEHERREEVIQYIYERYGRDRAALVAGVVTFQPRSAIREVGKALGLSLETVSTLARHTHHWTGNTLSAETFQEMGLNLFDPTIQNTLSLTRELIGFPRHLTQHVGGFIICDTPLREIVPIIPASMAGRTIIEWDKNDIEELGMLKIDVLALGMLTCIRKAFNEIQKRTGIEHSLYSIPQDDPAVYDMLCASDSMGVFQVESRAQMAMLPRLRPRTFYDLVIEVAIVRPGPIQGNMVHPYLRRRQGLERPYYPDKRVERILGKTLGVPIFQEQAMRLAISLANFTPGEAEKLRRAMSAWKTHEGVIQRFKIRIVKGMTENGYSESFAETCLNQIKGFSEYGFPESHAASFAHLVYASAWIKKHFPAEFTCALLNSQPMGFYAPAQLVEDAKRHGVDVLPIDAQVSAWNATLVDSPHTKHPSIRLGLRLIKGLRTSQAQALEEAPPIQAIGGTPDVSRLHAFRASNPTITKHTLSILADADAFGSLALPRRSAHWQIQSLATTQAPLDSFFTNRSIDDASQLVPLSKQAEMFADYASQGLSLRAHPCSFIRDTLDKKRCHTIESLHVRYGTKADSRVSIGGLVITRQRPGTAKGVVFLTLEDETGTANVVIRPSLFTNTRDIVMHARAVLAYGKLQRIGEVIYLEAQSITHLDIVKGAAPRNTPEIANRNVR